MGHTLTISDQAYEKLQVLARQRGQTLETYLEALAEQQTLAESESGRDPHTDPRYYTFEEFFRHLGMTDEEIEEAKAKADADDANV